MLANSCLPFTTSNVIRNNCSIVENFQLSCLAAVRYWKNARSVIRFRKDNHAWGIYGDAMEIIDVKEELKPCILYDKIGGFEGSSGVKSKETSV